MKKTLISGLLIVSLLAACTPTEGQRQPVYIGQAELIALMIYPAQISLHITGDLPTACNKFQAEVDGPDAQNRIDVTVYSTISPAVTCTQALQPFDESVLIPMLGEDDGTYRIFLNGNFVAEFEYSEPEN